MGEQFCLKWNNHQSTLISLFDTLLETERHVDCSLTSEGRVLKAHKVVLSACSPYLEELLNQHQDKYPILVFSDIKYDELRAMLDYMYRGEVNVVQEQLNGFLKAAESLQIKGLTDQGGGGGGDTAKRKAPRNPPPDPVQEMMSARQEDCVSPAVPAKRRRQRRPSSEHMSDSHVDNNSCDMPSTTAPVTKPSIETDRLSMPPVQPPPPVVVPPPLIKEKIEPPDMIQPKTEYIDDMNNDDQIEDLTLDDDDDEDSYMAKPGSSQGNDNSQGYDTNWQFSGDTSNSDMFLAAQQQDPSGNQSNSQEGVRESLWEYRLTDSGRRYAQCLRCEHHTAQRCDMLKHINDKHEPNPVLHRCHHCTFTAKQSSSLNHHVKTVHNPNPTFYTCPFCPYRTKYKQQSVLHVVSKHQRMLSGQPV